MQMSKEKKNKNKLNTNSSRNRNRNQIIIQNHNFKVGLVWCLAFTLVAGECEWRTENCDGCNANCGSLHFEVFCKCQLHSHTEALDYEMQWQQRQHPHINITVLC